MSDTNNLPSCCQCSTTALAICITCTRRFCWEHLGQHRSTYETYLDHIDQPLTNCLNEFHRIEEKLRSDIDRWEKETIAEVKNSAHQTRRSLDTYLNNYRGQFIEESANLRDMSSTISRETRLHRLETLQMDYERSLNELCLIKHDEHARMLDIESRNSTREQVTLDRSSQIAPEESGHYIPQTPLGESLIKEPLAKTPVGSYWAMGGSNQHLLVQEYENQQLILFDSQGNRGVSMTWPNNTPIRDINWYEETQRFFILTDKKLTLFDPVSKHLDEISEVKPYQSGAFRRCTCRHNRFFISYWGQESLMELVRINTWQTEQRWFSPVTCHANEFITSIHLNSLDQLGVCIQDENNPLSRQFRFEIRDITLNILHTFPLYVDSGYFSRITSLPDRHWALLNVDETLVFILNERAELIDRIEWPRGPLANIALIGENIVAIRTRDKIFFYDVQFQRRN